MGLLRRWSQVNWSAGAVKLGQLKRWCRVYWNSRTRTVEEVVLGLLDQRPSSIEE